MTLLPLGLGFLTVAALFAGFEWVAGARKRGNAVAVAAEALAVTLLGDLWFTSLGHGGWVLVFLLAGIAVSAASCRAERVSGTGIVKLTAFTTLRYLVAGGVLALIVG